MDFFKTITSNTYINTAVISWFTAQVLKVVLTSLTKGQLNLERITGNGGMPSSHTSFTVSLAILIMRTIGFNSAEFAIAFCLSVIVMTDAMGVRREAGKHAKVLNDVFSELSYIPRLFKPENAKSIEIDMEAIKELGKDKETPDKDTEDETSDMKLEEFLGHTPFEVLGGLILGIIIGFLVPIG